MRMENKILIVLTLIFLACFIGGMMAGCASYQPPGQGIWRAL